MKTGYRILFVQSYLGRPQRFFVFPVGAAVVAGFLRGDYVLKGFDPNACVDPWRALGEVIERFKPDLACVSLRNLDTTNYFDPHIFYNGFVVTIRALRQQLPKIPIVAGGAGFSLFPRKVMEEVTELDFGIVGEGEVTLPELLRNMNYPERVAGLLYRVADEVRQTPPRELRAFRDDDPLPAWEIFDLTPYLKQNSVVGVETKRGCAYKCVYCCYYLLNGHSYRLKSPERVLIELKALQRLGFMSATFTDSVFNTPVNHAKRILRLMREEMPGFGWSAYLSPIGLDDEFVRLCRETGLDVLVFSPDTVTDEALKRMGKQMTMHTLNAAVTIIERHPPVGMGVNFFVNGPGYTYGTLLAFASFVWRTRRKLGRRFPLLPLSKMGYIRVEPGTPIERIALAEGVITPQTNLLPTTIEEFDKTFYFNKNLKLFNAVFGSGKRYTRLFFARLSDRFMR